MDKKKVVKLWNDFTGEVIVEIFLIAVAAWFAVVAFKWVIRWLAERVPGRYRLYILPSVPLFRLLMLAVAITLIFPLIIRPTAENVLLILGSAGIAIGFAFKDYVSSLIAGVVAIYDRPYRNGDWVKIEDAYGEVKQVGLRAVRLVTADDTVVVVPNLKLWTTAIHNANDGTRFLQCVADFYLHPRHDASLVRQKLLDIALTSPFLQLERPVAVVVAEKPWGTHYRLKAYPVEPRDQFQFTSDLTIRGKAALTELGVEPVVVSAAMMEKSGGAEPVVQDATGKVF